MKIKGELIIEIEGDEEIIVREIESDDYKEVYIGKEGGEGGVFSSRTLADVVLAFYKEHF